MGKKQKNALRRHGMQVATLCISTTMVLILIGLMVLSVLGTRRMSDYVREHLTVTVMLSDSVSAADGRALGHQLAGQPYAKHVEYVSKEQALKEQTEAMGSDPSEFLGMNPFVASLELQVYADYANSDSLAKIAEGLYMHHQEVTDVAYQEDLTDRVNHNLQRVSLLLLAIVVLLIIICYSLISNSVQLSIYSRRFSIHTMKLVGASWAFIRWPFLRQALEVALIASVAACAVLGGLVCLLFRYQPGAGEVITWAELAVTAASVFFFGLVITLLCTYGAVNKFLRMKAGELYKI
jgi:cell division transport system permease protein